MSDLVGKSKMTNANTSFVVNNKLSKYPPVLSKGILKNLEKILEPEEDNGFIYFAKVYVLRNKKDSSESINYNIRIEILPHQ